MEMLPAFNSIGMMFCSVVLSGLDCVLIKVTSGKDEYPPKEFTMNLFSGIKYKIMMIFFALTPFIIGKMATYQKVKLYSFVQILIMLFSAAVTCLK